MANKYSNLGKYREALEMYEKVLSKFLRKKHNLIERLIFIVYQRIMINNQKFQILKLLSKISHISEYEFFFIARDNT